MIAALVEHRASYDNFIQFFRSGFGWDHIPIYLGFLVLIGLFIYVSQSRQSIHVKWLSLYFSTSLFTNYAYQFHRARLFDFIGIGITLMTGVILLKAKLKLWFCEKVMFVIIMVLFVHTLILYGLGYLHEYGGGASVFAGRLIMIVRALVLFFVILYFTNFVSNESQIAFIVSTFKYTGLAALMIMLVQEILFFQLGVSTVGLYQATAFIPIPRFGSISVEGGHFGRLIPVFLFYCITQKQYGLKIGLGFLALLLIAFSNISGSLYGYLFFIFAGLFIADRYFFRIKNSHLFLLFIAGAGLGIAFYFYDYAMLFFTKIDDLMFSAGRNGLYIPNRSIAFLPKALAAFPLGIGFGVSDRALPDGTYTDMGLYAIISQLSVLSVLILFFFVFYWRYLLSRFRKYKTTLLNKAYAPHALVMVLATPLIFLFDVVWLYPGYVLPFLILLVYIKNDCQGRFAVAPSMGQLACLAE